MPAERSGKMILVVEDNVLNADILSFFLSDYGYRYEIAENGFKAVEMYENDKYDLILMDIMLPGLNGYEATRQIIDKAGSESRPLVIGVTAKIDQDNREESKNAGMLDIVYKPIDFNLLCRTLDEHLFGVKPTIADNQAEDGVDEPKSGIVDFKVLNEYCIRVAEPGKSRQMILTRFIDAIETIFVDLRQAVEKEDLRDIERLAHSLKGSLGLIGAWNMQDLSKGFETAAHKGGETFRPVHWLAVLEGAFAEVKNALFPRSI